MGSGEWSEATPAYEAEEGTEPPDNLQMPMTITPIQAPKDIPRMKTSMVHSPLWTPPVRGG